MAILTPIFLHPQCDDKGEFRYYETSYVTTGHFASHIWARNPDEARKLSTIRGLNETIDGVAEWGVVDRTPRLASLFREKKYAQTAHGVTFLLSIVIHTNPAFTASCLRDDGLLHELIHKVVNKSFAVRKRPIDFEALLTNLEMMTPGYLPIPFK